MLKSIHFDEVEVEEDLGPVEDEAVPALDDNEFDIEVFQDDVGERVSDAEDADDEAEEEEAEEETPVPPKRQRKENTMVGGVRKENVDFYPLRHLLPSLLACIVALVET